MKKLDNKLLFLDIGNTNTKCYDSKLNLLFILSTNEEIDKIVKKINEYNDYKIYISKVLNPNCDIIISKLINNEVIDVRTLIQKDDIKNGLLKKRDVNQIGTDIVLGCLGGIAEGHSSFIIVDQGTACTVAVVKNNILIGVNIYPGWNTLINDFKRNTGLKVEYSEETNYENLLIGQDTNSALALGLGNMYWKTLKNDIKNLQEKFEIKTTLDGKDVIKKGFDLLVKQQS